MTIPLYQQVALVSDFPEKGLKAGDVVTRVEFLQSPKAGVPNGYCVEAFNALGNTIAVFVVHEHDIELLTEHDVLQVRHNQHSAEQLVVDIESSVEQNTHTGTGSTSIAIELSDEMLYTKGITREDFKLQLALYLFQQDLFSIGKASKLAGLHPAQFQKELARQQISVHYGSDDYAQDLIQSSARPSHH